MRAAATGWRRRGGGILPTGSTLGAPGATSDLWPRGNKSCPRPETRSLPSVRRQSPGHSVRPNHLICVMCVATAGSVVGGSLLFPALAQSAGRGRVERRWSTRWQRPWLQRQRTTRCEHPAQADSFIPLRMPLKGPDVPSGAPQIASRSQRASQPLRGSQRLTESVRRRSAGQPCPEDQRTALAQPTRP